MARTPKKVLKGAPTIRMEVDRLEDIEKLNPIIKDMILDAQRMPDAGGQAIFSLDFSLKF